MAVKRKLQQMKQGGQYFLILPKALVEASNWRKSDLINIGIKEGQFILWK